MPYITTRRSHHVFGRKVSKYFMYWKAKRMYNDINRGISAFESKFLKTRLHEV